jgi:putative transcriptional regulator
MAIVRKSAQDVFAKGPAFSPEARARLVSMTEGDIAAAADSDPDAQALSADQLDRMVFKRAVRLARAATGLSQSEFSRQFRLNLSRLKNWEQGRFPPDEMALAYLEVIRQAPDVVSNILGPSERAPKRVKRSTAAE